MTNKLDDYLPLDGLGGTYSEEQARQAIANAEAAANINSGGAGSGLLTTLLDRIPAKTKIEQILIANDKVETYSYLDAGTADARVSTITYSSASLSLSVTDTYSYAGTSGNYRISTITRS
jgi:hypothetical protein